MVHGARDLGIWVNVDEALVELVAIDGDSPCVVLDTQLLQHNPDLLAIGRRQGVQLQRSRPDVGLGAVSRPRRRPVHPSKLVACGAGEQFLDLRGRLPRVRWRIQSGGRSRGTHPCVVLRVASTYNRMEGIGFVFIDLGGGMCAPGRLIPTLLRHDFIALPW